MCRSTEMKHNTFHFLHFTQLTSRNPSLTTVNANFKRLEKTKFINKLTTNLCINKKSDIKHKNIGSVEQFIVIVKHNTLTFYIITFSISLTINYRLHVYIYVIQLMYSVTGQTEDQQADPRLQEMGFR